jgi:hypothetical protein
MFFLLISLRLFSNSLDSRFPGKDDPFLSLRRSLLRERGGGLFLPQSNCRIDDLLAALDLFGKSLHG